MLHAKGLAVKNQTVASASGNLAFMREIKTVLVRRGEGAVN